MPNVILQDVNAIIHGTSRHGLPYDVAHVSILMQTDAPISPDVQWAIPHVENLSPDVLKFISDGKTPIYPMLKDSTYRGASDILQETDKGDTASVIQDAKELILLSSMKPTTIEPLEGTTDRYIISYKYRLYPVEQNNFEFKVLLPFDGLGVANGGKLVLTLVAPAGATINPTITDAKDFSGQSVSNETITPITNTHKNIVSFQIQKDPIFTIRYNY
jgi:regulator of extracellular matrix RemA (YlzA/DUF370 family)